MFVPIGEYFLVLPQLTKLGFTGFAGGSTMKTNGVANPGFYDQRLSFEWVQTYIWAFGGNPLNITGMGLSSGGSSLLFQIAAYGGTVDLPFQRAIPQSPAWSPHSNQTEAEEFVANVTVAVNCTDFACLQSVDFTTLYSTAMTVANTYGYILQPRVDGVFVPELLDVMYMTGKFNPNVQILVGHEERSSISIKLTVDEAYFRPPTVTTFQANVLAVWDDISSSALSTMESLYPPADFDFNETARFLQADNDYQFNCKIYALNYAFNGSPYNYYFSVPPAIHTTDLSYTFNGGPNQGGPITNVTVADILQKYLISFIQTGNPNTVFPGLPYWPQYGSGVELNINQTFIDLMQTDLNTPQCHWWVQGLY
jgi:carboxylesterase type B